MNVSREQANVYKILTDIFLKFFLTIVFSIVFCVVMYFLLMADAVWSKTGPLAAIELALSGTVYKLAGHFFPTKK